MRDILKEYQWDWKLYAMMKGSAGITKGTPNEVLTMLQFMKPEAQERIMRMAAGGDAAFIMGNAMAEYYKNILTAHEQGKQIALVTYNFSPAVLFAMDIVPICLESLSGAIIQAFDKGVGEALDYCTEVGFPENRLFRAANRFGPHFGRTYGKTRYGAV